MILVRDILVQNSLVSKTFIETIKAIDGELFNISYHQKRYEEVLLSLGSNNFKDLKDYLDPPHVGIFRCRLLYSIDAIDVEYHRYKKREIASLKLVYDDNIDYSQKSTCREDLDRLFEMREICDEVLIIKNYLVSDTSIANVAFLMDKVWFTPSKPLLMGTTRQRLLDEGKIQEKDIKVEDLKSYSKMALLNAMIDFDIIQKNLKDLFC